MRIGILGTGIVGRTLAGRFEELGHDVVVGTRDPSATLSRDGNDAFGNPPFREWKSANPAVGLASFAVAAGHGEVIVNATLGLHTFEALKAAGDANIDGKILIDIANPLDFSHGMPPTVALVNGLSVAESIQRAFPTARVVKTLNTVSAPVMINPLSVAGGDHTIFVSGNDTAAKAVVVTLLQSLGWKDIMDLGDITSARAVEQYLALWLGLYGSLKTPLINIRVVR